MDKENRPPNRELAAALRLAHEIAGDGIVAVVLEDAITVVPPHKPTGNGHGREDFETGLS